MIDFKKYEIDEKYFQIEFPVDAAIAIKFGNKVPSEVKEKVKKYKRKMKILQKKKNEKWNSFKLDVKFENLGLSHVINDSDWKFIFTYADRKFSSYPYERMYEEILDIVETMLDTKPKGI
jgi:hypothetical protein